MRNDLTDITLVIDRSGSMVSCQSDAQGGIDNLIKEQQAAPGHALLTIVEFDTEYNVVCNGVPIENAPKYVLRPRGYTALLDATGRAIKTIGERLEAMEENSRPGCVIVVIVTDGHENSSKEFTRAIVRQMIEEQRTKYNWQFVYIGATAESFAEAASLSIPASSTTIRGPNKSFATYQITSNTILGCRSKLMSGHQVDCAFSEQDRKEMA